jgi:hypothetical protein
MHNKVAQMNALTEEKIAQIDQIVYHPEASAFYHKFFDKEYVISFAKFYTAFCIEI